MLRQHRVDQPVDSGRALALVAHTEAQIDHQRLPPGRGDTDGVAHRGDNGPWPETLPLARSEILRARSWAPGATPSKPLTPYRSCPAAMPATWVPWESSAEADRASAPPVARRDSPPASLAACDLVAPSRRSHVPRDSPAPAVRPTRSRRRRCRRAGPSRRCALTTTSGRVSAASPSPFTSDAGGAPSAELGERAAVVGSRDVQRPNSAEPAELPAARRRPYRPEALPCRATPCPRPRSPACPRSWAHRSTSSTQPRHPRVDAGVEDGDQHPAAVVVGMLTDELVRAGTRDRHPPVSVRDLRWGNALDRLLRRCRRPHRLRGRRASDGATEEEGPRRRASRRGMLGAGQQPGARPARRMRGMGSSGRRPRPAAAGRRDRGAARRSWRTP